MQKHYLYINHIYQLCVLSIRLTLTFEVPRNDSNGNKETRDQDSHKDR